MWIVQVTMDVLAMVSLIDFWTSSFSIAWTWNHDKGKDQTNLHIYELSMQEQQELGSVESKFL